jgi:hypothetical protein
MAKKKTPITELEFVRYLTTVNKDGKDDTNFIAQPYLVSGMYIAINFPGKMLPIQQGCSHKEYPKWVKGSIKKMEANGLTVTTVMAKYTDFYSESEVEKWIVPAL